MSHSQPDDPVPPLEESCDGYDEKVQREIDAENGVGIEDRIRRLESRAYKRGMVGAQAVGVLSALLSMRALPESQLELVRMIVKQWDEA